MNKKGMTLLELLVYMALAALLLAPVIMLMNDSSKNMARDASKTDLNISGRDLLNIIYDDLRNTGYKLNNLTNFTVTDAATYYFDSLACSDPICVDGFLHDSSSFRSYNGPNTDPEKYYDRLDIIKGVLNSSNDWVGIDTVRYYVSDSGATGTKRLTREVIEVRVSGGITRPPAKVLARNVVALQFQYSDNLIDWYDDYVYDSDVLTADPPIGGMYDKLLVKYIKVIIVLEDKKRLSPVDNQKIVVIPPDLDFPAVNQYLYERHEIVVPIPNNGCYPNNDNC